MKITSPAFSLRSNGKFHFWLFVIPLGPLSVSLGGVTGCDWGCRLEKSILWKLSFWTFLSNPSWQWCLLSFHAAPFDFSILRFFIFLLDPLSTCLGRVIGTLLRVSTWKVNFMRLVILNFPFKSVMTTLPSFIPCRPFWFFIFDTFHFPTWPSQYPQASLPSHPTEGLDLKSQFHQTYHPTFSFHFRHDNTSLYLSMPPLLIFHFLKNSLSYLTLSVPTSLPTQAPSWGFQAYKPILPFPWEPGPLDLTLTWSH